MFEKEKPSRKKKVRSSRHTRFGTKQKGPEADNLLVRATVLTGRRVQKCSRKHTPPQTETNTVREEGKAVKGIGVRSEVALDKSQRDPMQPS